LLITIQWYMEITAGLEIVVKRFSINPDLIFPSKTGMILLVLTALITVVLTGILLAYIYYQKTVDLFRLQHNFIYNFTHELKTPVTSLKIYLETFTKHDLEAKDIKKYSGYMLEDISKLTESINSILNLAKIESRSYGSELTDESPTRLVENFCEKNAKLFHNCEIAIENHESENFICPVNTFLFEMLLMNIISNAIKYNESETPLVKIKYHYLKHNIMIEFIDNGIGIEKKETKKVFRKFYQSKRGEQGDVEGSGLGLYLVFNIARIHDWKITVSSDGLGKGSIFTLTIPKLNPDDFIRNFLWKLLKRNVFWS
ncbi:MAG: HAMP domain-containing histidine kinase, partial [Desulfobacteraceae bacterium]|nr:HAMP domain-containing histidine kinase [Desulfobacteraceae bacterium]